LIAPDLLNRSVRFVLVNAIYLKAACSAPFYEKNTAQRPFHIDATKDIAVPTMNGGDFNRGMENDDLQALQLGYAQSQLAMVFLLPRKPDGLASLEKQLTMQHLQQWIGALGSCFVRDAYLPKFKINASFALSDDLAQLGMADAFAPSANFGGIANTQPLKLSSVVHQSFLRIDEKGTEAAAATAVGGGAFGTSGHAISFVADHPFLFIIRDSGTGAILFMGRIVIPQG